jgi:hypothetical protein
MKANKERMSNMDNFFIFKLLFPMIGDLGIIRHVPASTETVIILPGEDKDVWIQVTFIQMDSLAINQLPGRLRTQVVTVREHIVAAGDLQLMVQQGRRDVNEGVTITERAIEILRLGVVVEQPLWNPAQRMTSPENAGEGLYRRIAREKTSRNVLQRFTIKECRGKRICIGTVCKQVFRQGRQAVTVLESPVEITGRSGLLE